MNIFTNRPLFTSCMLFLLSSIVGYFLPFLYKIIIMIVAGLILIVSVLLTILKQLDATKKYAFLCITICSSMILASTLSSFLYFNIQQNKYDEYYGNKLCIKATVTSEKYEQSSMGIYTVSVHEIGGEKTNHKATLECQYESALELGDSIQVLVMAQSPEESGGRFNEKTSMLSDGMFISYISYEPDSLIITECGKVTVKTFFFSVNKRLSGMFTSNISGEAGRLSAAIFLGNKGLLSNTTARDFTRAGVSHILALSGTHMSIIMGAMMLLLKRITTKSKLIAVVLSVFALTYLAITGFSVSATRSVIMLLIVYLSILISGTYDSLTSLSVAGFLIVLISPGAVLDAGFWMSFAATLGILAYMPLFRDAFNRIMHSPRKWLNFALKILKPISLAVATGLSAFIPLICVMCIFIKELPLYSIVSSLVLSLPSSALILLSMLFLPVANIPFISTAIASAIIFISDTMIGYCDLISNMKGVVLSLNYPFAWIAAIVIGACIIYSLICKSKRVYKVFLPFALSLTLFFGAIWLYESQANDSVKVSYINASSTSDLLVVSCGQGATICDMSNGSKSSYHKILDELYESRITEIDSIVLTRYSYAHNATLSYIFSSEKVYEVWLPYPESLDEYYKMEALFEIAEKNGVNAYLYEYGEVLHTIDSVRIESLRESIDRSKVPLSLISIYTLSDRTVYASPAFNESESLLQRAELFFSKSKYVVFGNKGPVTKIPYTIENTNKLQAVAFADEERVAYFDSTDIYDLAFFIVPQKIDFYMDK